MKLSLRSRLFTSFFALIAIPLILIGIIAYYTVTGIIEEKYSRQAELTLRALSQSVDFVFREMDKMTDSTIASTALQDVLSNQNFDYQNLSQVEYLRLNGIQRNFRELLVNHPSVSYAFLYTFADKQTIPLYIKEFDAMPFDLFQQQELYKQVLDRDGLPKWVGPYEYPELTGSDPVFTQLRVVKDIPTLTNKGLLFVQIKNSGLEAIFREFSYDREKYHTRFLITNDKGLILFDSNGQMNGHKLGDEAKDGVPLLEDFASGRKEFAGEDSVVSSIGMGQEDWHLVSVTSWRSLSGEIMRYSRWVAVIMGLFLLSALIFLLFFVNRVAKSIIRVVRFMRRVESGQMNIRLEEKGDTELQLMAKGLNSLISQVNVLLSQVRTEQDQKYRAEMRALQAQIKPHFLFNTLESINVLAVQNEGRKVSQMVLRLASILRISIHGKEEIPLRQEIEHLQSYLEIQKFRFVDTFEYEIDAPEEWMDCLVPKLTLQPLVENCIQHGFDGLERVGKIVIRAKGEPEAKRLILTVEDNGVGIPGEVLARFQYMAEDEGQGDEEGTPAHPERRGLGVRSVADRIRIQYGRHYGLFISSLVGSGTEIRCVLPLNGVIYRLDDGGEEQSA